MKYSFFLLLFSLSLFAKNETIVVGAGCFWGVENYFTHLHGVKDVEVGYAGGNYDNPTYKKVLSHRKNSFFDMFHTNDDNVTNHAEVVKIIYDDTQITTRKILEAFWEIHNPTQGDRQGNDVGNNYRSIIFYTTPEQKKIVLQTKKEFQQLLNAQGFGKITTEIHPLKKFYKAEEYHQDYLQKHPNGYCPNHETGVKFPKKYTQTNFITPLGDKEIIVVEAPHCPYCKAFEKDVLSSYHASLPLRVAQAQQLKNFQFKTTTFATPTIFFINNGKEVFAHVGSMDKKSFYKALGALKLGKESEAYDVAFHKSTDRRFCKKYDQFKHTGDGVFVDAISGDILFDTKDRFNSGSGWLSFYKAVDGSVIEKEDNSFFMHRTEIIAKKSGAHLGHKFHDAPNGRYRYCINATVLEFVKREDLEQWKKSH